MSVELHLEAANGASVIFINKESTERATSEYTLLKDNRSIYFINGLLWLDLMGRGPEAS